MPVATAQCTKISVYDAAGEFDRNSLEKYKNIFPMNLLLSLLADCVRTNSELIQWVSSRHSVNPDRNFWIYIGRRKSKKYKFFYEQIRKSNRSSIGQKLILSNTRINNAREKSVHVFRL